MSGVLVHQLKGLQEEPVVDISCEEEPCSPLPQLSDVPAPFLFTVPLPPAFYSGSVVTVYIWDKHITVHLTIPGKAASSRESWFQTLW